MSQLLIQKYLNELATLRRVSGTHRESVVREAFKDLLKGYARSRDLTFVAEYQCDTKVKERRYVDGALLHTLRVPLGYWEAKDTKDDLDSEIEKKFRAGYPKTNIIFEDSSEAVLIQHGEEVMRCGVEDLERLEKLLDLFFSYERPEIEAFRKAVQQFKADLPAVLESLRTMIERAHKAEPTFREASEDFLIHAREAINPNLTAADVREMLIQHVLTGEVFAAVFPGTTYHEDNNVAVEMHKLEATFFTGDTKFQALKGLDPYYAAIRKAGSQISTHHEKQTFLKAIYENFYKVYNPKAADRLGVVYTPNEIVRFIIESADWLCEKHFGRNLIDKDVDILDPATGTGTFICELIEHFAGRPAKLAHKYQLELHANEVAILPYYVANLNIEATYAAATGRYEQFPGLCLVDTLDNTFALKQHKGHQGDLFGAVSDDNVKRIRRQNRKEISVILGNPPYNAWQGNFNLRNPNRPYREIDKRIGATYGALGTAQNQMALYDMYVRFFRWAADRLSENGILAFISNRNFLSGNTFDGLRRALIEEFNEIRIIDLGGDVRANPKLSGTTHNVFGIQTGVTISFLVRRRGAKGCRLFVTERPEMEVAADKLGWLARTAVDDIPYHELKPERGKAWAEPGDTSFDSHLALIDKDIKSGITTSRNAIFRLFSAGLKSQRDDWVYDRSKNLLAKKMRFFVSEYERSRESGVKSLAIKWDPTLEALLSRGVATKYSAKMVTLALYRPYVRRYLYFDSHFIGRQYQMPALFGAGSSENIAFAFSDRGSRSPFSVLASRMIPELHLCASTDAFQVVPLQTLSKGQDARADNITDWALARFQEKYESVAGTKPRRITREEIFRYCYGVLHDPIYREKYAVNLKHEFPRIPFYADFWQWADWGRALIELHLGFGSVAPFPLQRVDVPDEKARIAGHTPKAMLKARKEEGHIQVDSETTLVGIPPEAWNYKLGNRSALEWILDQHKEKAPKDPTIRENFDTYRFAEHKEEAIDLLARVTTVSVETMRIVGEMQRSHESKADRTKSRPGPRGVKVMKGD